MRKISFSIAGVVALMSFAIGPALAEAPQDACNRLAGDSVPIKQVNAASAVPACAAAVKAAPGTPRLEYEYGRALEKSGSIDSAKEMYQWASDDGFAPATTALARIAARPPSAAVSESDRRQRIASQLDALADVANGIAKAAPRDHDDPVAVLSITGTEPASIFSWVRTNTRLIPYTGMLRGVSGVLMDRAGNSLDRSLLLADLLHRAGYEVRLARAQLPPDLADALRAKITASIPKSPPPAALDRATLLKIVANDPRLDSATVQKAVDMTIASNQRFESTVKDLYGKVLPAVKQAIGRDPKRDQQLAADADASLRDHFWVQRRVAKGWEDLDLDADIVHGLTPTSTSLPDEIPNELKHEVTLRLVLETWSAGKLSRTKLLERTWLPGEIGSKSITLSHLLLPQQPLSELGKQAAPQAAYIAGLKKAWVIEPMLKVGDDTITDRLYTLGGQVLPAGAPTLASLGVAGFANFAKVQQGITAAFGNGSAPSGPPDEASSPIKVTAEWLEIEIAVPGHAPEIHRRAIFDLLGAAARAAAGPVKAPIIGASAKEQRAFALSGDIDVYVFAATPSASWLQHKVGEILAGGAAETASLMRSARSADDLASAKPVGRLELPLWGWAATRFASDLAPNGAPVEANVALFWQTAAPNPKSGIDLKGMFDIVSNGVFADTNFTSRVAQGVLDTVIERAMFDEPGPGGNTAALQAEDLSAGRQWITISRSNDGAIDKLDLSPDAQAALRADVANGNLVIAPASVPTAGAISWWRVDLRSGTTLGVNQSGMGGMAEYGNLLFNVMRTGVCGYLIVEEAIHLSPIGVLSAGLCAMGGLKGAIGIGERMYIPLAIYDFPVAPIREGALDFVIELFVMSVAPPLGH